METPQKRRGQKANTLAKEQVERQAARIVRAMAYDRQAFKDHIESPLSGAILEFYKAALARKNGQTAWIAHWEGEVEQLLKYTLFAALVHDIRGFKDRQKAFDEVVRRIQEHDAGYRHVARHQVLRDHGMRKVRNEIDDRDTAQFWERVQIVEEDALRHLQERG